MDLLAKDRLTKTGPVDYAEWNYRPILGYIQRLRFSVALSLLPRRAHRLLEVGYGSGVFMPALASVATELYGIDTHEKSAEVAAALADTSLKPKLTRAAAEAIPFDDATFDSVVAISSLEFVDDLSQACLEINRVLQPAGKFVVITPGKSTVVDLGLRLLTGNSAKRDFGDRRETIVPTLLTHFGLEKQRGVPLLPGLPLLYSALRLTKRAPTNV